MFWAVYHSDFGQLPRLFETRQDAQADANERNAEIFDERSNYHVVVADLSQS